MSAETRDFTPKQLEAQRIYLREARGESQPGDGLKRLGTHTVMLGVATVGDLVESHLADVVRQPMKKREHEAKKEYYDHFDKTAFDSATRIVEANEGNISDAKAYVDLINGLSRDAKVKTGQHDAVEFAEEWLSDGVYASLANAWVRHATGMDDAKYVSETAAFIADWSNTLYQVFGGDKFLPERFVYPKGDPKAGEPMRTKLGIKKAYQTMDFINSVNVEAAIRVVEEVPVVGDGVSWLHEKFDKLIESTIGQKANTLVAKGMLGYHVGRNARGL
jgi:hypothetical protein